MLGNPADVQQLIRQARDGDADAQGRLFEAYRTYLRRLADRQLRGRVAGRLDASDVVQETCLQAHRYFGQFAGADEPTLTAWLHRILDQNVARVIRDHVLLQKRDVRRERSLEDSHGTGTALCDDLDAGTSAPARRVVRQEEIDGLFRALATLPAEQREVVRLRHLEGWPLARIANKLGKTTTAAAGLLKRGMQALRTQLHPDE